MGVREQLAADAHRIVRDGRVLDIVPLMSAHVATMQSVRVRLSAAKALIRGTALSAPEKNNGPKSAVSARACW